MTANTIKTIECDVTIKEESNGYFICDLCKCVFDSRQDRMDHLLTHFLQSNCESCGKPVLKICDLLLDIHGADSCCKSTIVASNVGSQDDFGIVKSNDELAMSQSEDGIIIQNCMLDAEPPAKEKSKVSNKWALPSETNKSRISPQPQRKSSRVRKKVKYHTDSDDDETAILHRGKRKDSLCNATSNVSPECHLEMEMLSADTSDIPIKLEDIDNTNDAWSPPGDDVPFKIHRPDGAISSDEILDGDTADENTYLSIRRSESAARKKRNPPQPLNIPCSVCRTLFRTQRTLQIHEKQAHGISPSTECDICNKIFTSVGNLKQHKQTHNDTRRYICSYCGKGFNLHFNLKDHMNEHTGERPYICSICGKAFGKASHRVAHLRVHTGEKPYRCTFENCERSYAHSTDLKRHRRAQHGIITKTFNCPVCEKLFYENKFLTKHLKVHKEKN